MDLIRGETGEASWHVPITMAVCVCVCVCVCVADKTSEQFQSGNVSAVVNRGTLCLELLLGAVQRGSPLSARRRADGRQREQQIKWAGVGEEHRLTLRAAEMYCVSSNPRLISVEGGLRENRGQLTIQTRIVGEEGVQREQTCVCWLLAQQKWRTTPTPSSYSP